MPPTGRVLALLAAGCLLTGCAVPAYTVRGTPAPDESPMNLQIERTISALQARAFTRQGARRVLPGERLWGFDVPALVDRLRRVTERPGLPYTVWVYEEEDPNAAALADGRIYVSTGMLRYLADRGEEPDEPLDSVPRLRSGPSPEWESRDSASPRTSTALGTPSERSESRGSGRMPSGVEAELAFVLAHELAHTVAQHLVRRYHQLRRQQALLALVSAGAAAATRGAGPGGQQAGQLAVDVASLLNEVAISGYSQEQELEADQLGIRYLQRAGFTPEAALTLLNDFQRFERGGAFLRTHPYAAERRAHLVRYLAETGASPGHVGATEDGLEARKQALRAAQELYPRNSVSWQNLQRQLDALDAGGR